MRDHSAANVAVICAVGHGEKHVGVGPADPTTQNVLRVSGGGTVPIMFHFQPSHVNSNDIVRNCDQRSTHFRCTSGMRIRATPSMPSTDS